MYFYPLSYQKKVEAWRRGEIDWDTGKPLEGAENAHDGVHYDKLAAEKIKRLTIYLRLDSMPNLLAFASLFGGNSDKPAAKLHPSKDVTLSKDANDASVTDVIPVRPVEAYGLRLLNLTDRGSSVMQVSEMDSYTAYDPVVNTFRTFGRLHNLAVSGEVLVVPESSFAETLGMRASDSDLLVLPWSETGGMSEQAIIEDKGTKNKLAASSYISFVNSTFANSSIPVAVLINKNFGGSKNKETKQRSRLTRMHSDISLASSREKVVTAPIQDRSHHVFFPFFGGNDDRAALRLVFQLAENPQVTATIVYFDVQDLFLASDTPSSTSQTLGKAGEIVTTSSTSGREQDVAFFAALRDSLPADIANRVVFETVTSAAPVKDVIARAGIEVGQAARNAGDLVVLGRNIGRNSVLSADDGEDEIASVSSASSTLGLLAEKVWEGKLGASVLVVKAAA